MSLWLAMAASAASAAAPVTPPTAPSVPATVRVDFDRHSVTPVIARGLADRATGRMASADSPVRIASISKLFVALGVMRMVDAGKLDLDRDVSDYLGYTLRNPAFPAVPITLAQLLSHTSSLRDDADYAIPFGRSLKATLDDPRAWDRGHAPGGWFHYTNLNFPVIASVMERASGERFDTLMRRIVFQPLRLDACFNWSGCSAGAAARGVVLYRSTGEVAKDDLNGRLPDCPVALADGVACDLSGYRLGDNGAIFSPQGGVRIAMRDLARVGQMLAQRGRGFLSAASFARMTAPRLTLGKGLTPSGDSENGYYCAYGLAVQTLGTGGPGCNDDPFGDGRVRIGHSGEAYGLRSGLWLDPKTGRGTAFFTTAVADDAPRGHSAFFQVEEEVLRAPPAPPASPR